MQPHANSGHPSPTPPPPPTLFLLHALGMDRTEWSAVSAELEPGITTVALDLPGFGDNRSSGYTCRKMADDVARTIAARPRPGGDPEASAPWMIAGHSMGGRVAMIVAAMAESGMAGLDGLTHLVLVASSTPAPEPMPEDVRSRMLDWVKDGRELSPGDAASFVEDNTAAPLQADRRDVALGALAKTDPLAWHHWLDRGSREDWSGIVGLLRTPALIVAGAEDGPLGAETQTQVNAAHFADATCEVVKDAAHLIPLEQPSALASLVRRFMEVDRPLSALPNGTASLLTGSRVSARTRAVHLERVRTHEVPDSVAPYRASLTALVEAVVPGHGASVPDLLERVATALASGDGDGWRFADLPPDEAAWAQGFDALELLAQERDNAFADLSPEARDVLLRDVAAEDVAPARVTAQFLSRWFEDMRARIVRAWVAHPATMARIGYDGFANGGDGPRPQGYIRTAADTVERWQSISTEVSE